MLGRSLLLRRSVVGVGVRGLSGSAGPKQGWKKHGKRPLTKIVATIGPASEHMPTLQQ